MKSNRVQVVIIAGFILPWIALNITNIQLSTIHPSNHESINQSDMEDLLEDFESFNIGDQLITSSEWHDLPFGSLEPVVVYVNENKKAHFEDKTSSNQHFICMDLPAGSGLVDWQIEFKIIWVSGRSVFEAADDYLFYSEADRMFCVAVGSSGATSSGEVKWLDSSRIFQSLDTPTFFSTGSEHKITVTKTQKNPDSYSLYIDDVIKHSDAPAWHEQTTNLTRIITGTALDFSNDEYYLDDISARYSGPGDDNEEPDPQDPDPEPDDPQTGPYIISESLLPYGFSVTIESHENTTLFLDTIPLTLDDPFVTSLPDGLLPAKNACFHVALANDDGFISGSGQFIYEQSELASQVFEGELVVLSWNASNSKWIKIGSILDKTNNKVEFPVEPSGIYMLVGKPKQNYEIIATLSIPSGAIVGGALFNARHKKIHKVPVRKKKRNDAYKTL